MKKFIVLNLIIMLVHQSVILAQSPKFIWITEPKYEQISKFSEGIAPIKYNGNWGYINNNGSIIIPCKYKNVTSFWKNEAMVYSRNSWELINSKGEKINDVRYSDPFLFNEGLAIRKQTYHRDFGLEDRYGYVDSLNNPVIRIKYTGAGAFSEGLAPVRKNDKWGYINKFEEVIIDLQFTEAESFIDGKALVKSKGLWGYINNEGKFLCKLNFEELKQFSEELAPSKMNGKWGFIDESFNLAIEYSFDDVSGFSDSFAAIKKNGKWGFIDKKGDIIISCIYNSVTDFINGLAFVQNEGKWGCINKNGEIVVDYEFDDVKYSISNIIAVKKANLWGLVKIKNRREEIKQYVSNKLEPWQKKGRYEKTDDYLIRVNEQTHQLKGQEFTQEAINFFALQEKNLEVKSIDYDADNEAFKLTYENINPIYLNVPIKDAESFDLNISKIDYSDFQFTLDENEEFALLHLKATNPAINKSYNFDAKDVIAYNVTKLDLNFDEINVNIQSQLPPLIKETTNTLKIGKSDVDFGIPESAVKNKNTFAVIIGNEDYEHEIKVEYAKNDAEIFSQYAIKTLGIPANQVHLIENATIGAFMHEIDWLNKVAKGYNGDAKIIFYYAGHGMPDQSSKDAFILPVDSYSSNTRTAIKLQDIYSQLNEFPTKSVTIFLDACFSGSSREGMLAVGRGVKIVPKDQIIEKNMIVFTAVSGEETAHPYLDKQHGLFTYYLLKKLQETEGEVSLGELEEYISSNVLKKSVVLHMEQNPTVKASSALNDSWKAWKLK